MAHSWILPSSPASRETAGVQFFRHFSPAPSTPCAARSAGGARTSRSSHAMGHLSQDGHDRGRSPLGFH
eukprot:6710337-Alexandrium_andersonii.AAC.1